MKNRIKGLDGLRALAVLGVFFTHRTAIGNDFGFGGSCVRMFFVLSGFLIIGILADRHEAIENGRTAFKLELQRFYANRLYRIWPIYYLFIAICVLLSALALTPPIGHAHLVSLITFTANIWQAYFTGPDWHETTGALWSIAIEEQFYLWAAPVFLLAARKRMPMICWGVVGLSVVAHVVSDRLGMPRRSLYVGSIVNFGLMALGGLAWLRADQLKVSGLAAPALAIYALIPVINWYLVDAGDLIRPIGWLSTVLIAIALVDILKSQSSLTVYLLELFPLRWLGKVSYGFYLYHSIPFSKILGKWLPLAASDNVHLPLDLALSLAAAGLSWHFIEAPLLRLRDHRRSRSAALAGPLPQGT